MAYIRKTKMRSNMKVWVACLVGILLLVFPLAYYITTKNGEGEISTQNALTMMKEDEISIIRANCDIQAGEIADSSKFETVMVPKELVPVDVVLSMQQLRGKRLATSASAKEFLLQKNLVESSEWYEEDDRLVEHTFEEGAIPTTINVGSVVDIKLFRPNRSDDVVVSKTIVIGKLDKVLSFYLNQVEQEYIKEASTEGFLFLVQYLDKSQSSSPVTYLPVHDSPTSRMETGTKTQFENSSMNKE